MRARIGLGLVLLTAAVGLLAVGPAPADVAPRLPDLDPVAPYHVTVFSKRSGRRVRHHIEFGSAAENVGKGRLVVAGHRPDTATRLMTADQLLDTDDTATGGAGTQRTVPGVGVLRYTRSPDHSHWHFLGFMRYELRRASNFRRVARDRKTGFCLGDRYSVGIFELRVARAAGQNGEFDDECGEGQRGLLRLTEGISPGKGDDYKPRLEGQSLEITGLPTGRYLVVHRVNPHGRLREANYFNNVSSTLISIVRRRGNRRPVVTTLEACTHTARCR